MSLRQVPLKVHYISGVDDLVKDFYILTLEKSTLYQRRTGYFNSRALAMASRGLSGLLRNGGRMQLICSVELETDEREVYEEASKQEKALNKKAEDVARMLEKPYDELERDRLALLAELLHQGLLEIKIAYPKVGIYHEKVGIFHDPEGNIIAFSGSDNETPGGWENNTESFHVFNSWEDQRHIRPEIETFDALWNNRLEGTTVIPLPEAVKRNIIRYKAPEVWKGVERSDPIDMRVKPGRPWEWTPELAYIVESPRLWNHADFAYGDVGITPFEHQDYVAASVLKDWPPRCMLCDEVGLGKTIEAGLIFHGFEQAGRLDRVLILAPKNILKQWQLQLLSKFNIVAWRLEGDYVLGPQPDPNLPAERTRVDAINPFRTKPVMLVSSQLIRSDRRLEQLLGVEYDLVFLDEAHHARARGPSGKRQANKLLEAMEQLKLQTQGLIFMTATPIQLDRKELWDLLMILELPGLWQDEDNFDQFYSEINKPVPDWPHLFSMVQSGLRTWGIDEQTLALVQKEYPTVDVDALLQRIKDGRYHDLNALTDKEKEALKVLLFRHTPAYRMIYRNTRELLKRYHKEGKFRERIAEREPQPPDSIALAGSEDDPRSEAGLYDKIDEYVREYYAQYNDVRKGLGFLMEVYRKRLTSSFHAIRLSLQRRQDTLAEALRTGNYDLIVRQTQQEDEDDEGLEMPDELAEEFEDGSLKGSERTREHLRSVLQAEHDFLDSFVNNLRDLPSDSKFEYLGDLLRKKLSSGVRRVIIFSQFKDTVDFLLDNLRPIYGEKLGSYTGEGGSYWTNGQWVKCSKQKIQEKFRTEDDPLSILICTDAASEGLDLQSCNTLINYDIPWNPMRIEQRIGRVDRIGQASPKVYVHTLYYKGTVEEDVYNVCLERIEKFRSTLGHIQPILIGGNVERIIRRGALARTKEDRDKVLRDMRGELDKSIAEVEENIRIFHFLNQYQPQLQLGRREVPVSQAEMEDALSSHLQISGWRRAGDCWEKENDAITFNPKVLDQKDKRARLVTPNSGVAAILGRSGIMPEVISGSGTELHRLDIDGMTGFVVKNNTGWSIISNIRDIKEPSGRSFITRDAAEMHLRFIVRERKLESVRSQLRSWNNRADSWGSRARMYLDKVLSYVWREKGNTLENNDGTVVRVWEEYLRDPERYETDRLARTCSFRPTADMVRPRNRGRISKISPRSSEKEGRLLEEYQAISQRIIVLNRQEKDLIS